MFPLPPKKFKFIKIFTQKSPNLKSNFGDLAFDVKHYIWGIACTHLFVFPSKGHAQNALGIATHGNPV